MQKPQYGSGKRPSKDIPKLKLAWRRCTISVTACPKMTQKSQHGSEKRPSKGTPKLKLA